VAEELNRGLIRKTFGTREYLQRHNFTFQPDYARKRAIATVVLHESQVIESDGELTVPAVLGNLDL
jgi:hypothetical protein